MITSIPPTDALLRTAALCLLLAAVPPNVRGQDRDEDAPREIIEIRASVLSGIDSPASATDLFGPDAGDGSAGMTDTSDEAAAVIESLVERGQIGALAPSDTLWADVLLDDSYFVRNGMLVEVTLIGPDGEPRHETIEHSSLPLWMHRRMERFTRTGALAALSTTSMLPPERTARYAEHHYYYVTVSACTL